MVSRHHRARLVPRARMHLCHLVGCWRLMSCKVLHVSGLAARRNRARRLGEQLEPRSRRAGQSWGSWATRAARGSRHHLCAEPVVSDRRRWSVGGASASPNCTHDLPCEIAPLLRAALAWLIFATEIRQGLAGRHHPFDVHLPKLGERTGGVAASAWKVVVYCSFLRLKLGHQQPANPGSAQNLRGLCSARLRASKAGIFLWLYF